jgi:blue copper oxidase
MFTRRRFAIGAAAMTSASIVGWRIAEARASHFNTPLPIPRLIDAAKQENAVSLTIAAGRHAFVEGKSVKTYGYSAPILGPVIRMRRGDKIEIMRMKPKRRSRLIDLEDRAPTIAWMN